MRDELIWLHGASAGDLRALAPLVDALRRAGARPLLTTWTRTGHQMGARLYGGLRVHRPPAPIAPLAGRFIERWRPRLLILEYLELWPAWIAACAARGVPVMVIDGRVTHRSLRIRPLLRPAAGRLARFCAQTAADAEAAARLGGPEARIRVHGNGKYDGVPADPPQPAPELVEAVGPINVVIGSLHADEEDAALAALAPTPHRVLIAPRYPARAARLMRQAARRGLTARLRSAGPGDARVVVLDTMGELAAAYALAPAAIVGGTFGARGGQNLIEPAAHGVPVVHGPSVANIRVEVEALAGRGAVPVADWPAAFRAVDALRAAPRLDARPALAALRGATARHLAEIEAILADA